MSKAWDAIIIGGGAAGLFCAGVAGQLGKKILVVDHANAIGEKIRISGGGRCNFTNLHNSHANYLSHNPQFSKSALKRYPAINFLKLVESYRIQYHEKHDGQLFCDESARSIVQLLLSECGKGNVTIRNPVLVKSVDQGKDFWSVTTSLGVETAKAVVMATGGLTVPAMGSTTYSLDIAKKFNLPIVEIRPGLVPLSFTTTSFDHFHDLAGLSLSICIKSGTKEHRYGACRFQEELLITHKGFSGPAVLQASSYWNEGESITIDWLGSSNTHDSELICDTLFKNDDFRLKLTETVLSNILPQRLAKVFATQNNLLGRKWAEVGKRDRQALKNSLVNWSVKPASTLGWKKAEVMLGGVDTNFLEGQSMMSKHHQGLFFIGECVDVTGQLGGYNFQWAWASAFACANAL